MEIEIGNVNEVEIDISNQDDVEIEADTQVYKNDTFHNNLKNLDYEHSGHTGFQPAGNYVTEEELDDKGYLTELPEGTVIDSNYVHTDNNFDNQRKNKLDDLENYDDTEIKEDIANLENSKIDKVEGKGLSTNDFTNEYKNNVDSNTSARHIHTNKETLDNIDDTDIANWNNKAETSDIPDVSRFITVSVNDLVNYYLKSETYTKLEVNNLISAIEKATFSIVNELPATGQSNVIYLVPSSNPKTRNVKDEYIWLNNTWEQIGSTQIDLTGYATETWVNAQISSFLTQSQIETLISTAVSGKYTKPSGGIPKTDLDINVQSSLNKADSALQEHQDISGKFDKSKVKDTTSTTAGDVYDVTYINDMIGDIETILTRLTTGSGV